MKKTVAIISFAVAAFAVQAADQTISFNNNNQGTPRLVTWDSTFGALANQGVKNGTADGASYVAQLFIKNGDGSLTAVGCYRQFPRCDHFGRWHLVWWHSHCDRCGAGNCSELGCPRVGQFSG